MGNRLKYNFKFISPALPHFFLTLLFLLLLFIAFLIILHFFLFPELSFFSQCLHTFLNIQFSQRTNLPSHIYEAYFPCFNRLLHHKKGIFFSAHILDFRKDQFMHAGVSISICELEEVIAVKVRYLLLDPSILQLVQMIIEFQIFPL